LPSGEGAPMKYGSAASAQTWRTTILGGLAAEVSDAYVRLASGRDTQPRMIIRASPRGDH
jgi:hypothetical protein